MLKTEFIEAEKILDICEEIFFELAHENMDEKTSKLVELNANNLFIEIQGELSDWLDIFSEPPSSSCYLEVKIFLAPPEANVINLAKLLLPVSFENNNAADDSDEDESRTFHIFWY